MNLLSMLTQAGDAPKPKKRGSNLAVIHDAQRRATENKYRKHLEGRTLTTQELAERLGVMSQNIHRTLDRMAAAGLVERIELHTQGPDGGRPPIRWTWVSK